MHASTLQSLASKADNDEKFNNSFLRAYQTWNSFLRMRASEPTAQLNYSPFFVARPRGK